ncbi:MAG TPA: DNA repair protein RadA, partial [Thermomicrobiales bacterium]|nr:DNA repair protein RadA [Thermomicrobiales bacterium]
MAKQRSKYVCQQCGLESPGYYGRCPDCGAWGSMVETVTAPPQRGELRASTGTATTTARRLKDVPSADVARRPVPMREFSRVLGGGAVPGALVLVGGDPGIGKSTLLLQCASGIAEAGGPVLYVTGEESAQQVRLRADRLGLHSDDLFVMAETHLDTILRQAETLQPSVLVVDSIQTVYVDEITSAAGSVSQVRECTSRLMAYAKPRDVTAFIVGHVTKEGAIAGPRVLEHMVDAVLYLEGERFQQYRILRAVKNRFGSTDEVGVFEMVESGMREVRNPSEAFLEERSQNAAGSTVIVTMEGTRPILVEVQGLTTTAAYGNARRSANGFDLSRLQMLVAVLSKRVGLALNDQDIYVNVVGGLRAIEPAADLGVALAIAS